MTIALNHTESQLVADIRKGEKEAIAKAYRQHFPMVENFILQNSGARHDAKDIYQEAFMVLYGNLRDKNFRLECRLKTYLYSVARRLWLKTLHERKGRNDDIEDQEHYLIFDDTALEQMQELSLIHI